MDWKKIKKVSGIYTAAENKQGIDCYSKFGVQPERVGVPMIVGGWPSNGDYCIDGV